MSDARLKILIVEDDEISRRFLEMIFRRSGEDLFFAETGRQAIEVFCDNPEIDLILLDARMPDISGYEVVQRIRMFNKEVVIMQTANVYPDAKEEAIALGCDDFIAKPVNPDRLRTKISQIFLARSGDNCSLLV